MEQADDTNQEFQGSIWKERFKNLKKETRDRAATRDLARLARKINWKSEGLMKKLRESISKHKFLEE